MRGTLGFRDDSSFGLEFNFFPPLDQLSALPQCLHVSPSLFRRRPIRFLSPLAHIQGDPLCENFPYQSPSTAMVLRQPIYTGRDP